MAKPIASNGKGTARPARRTRGFEPAVGLMRDRIRTVGEARGFAASRILTHWAEVVGEDTARQCRPVNVSYKKGGFGATLTLLTTGPAAPILQMQLPAIRDRVNAVYGYNAIARISLTQTAPQGFAEGQAQFGPAPTPHPKAPPPQIVREASALSQGVGDEGLRRALEALACNVLARNAPGQMG